MGALMRLIMAGVVGSAGVLGSAAGPAVAGAAGPVTVARYTFDGGVYGGTVADDSGRGNPLTVHSRAGGTIRSVPGTGGLGVAFPGRCSGDCPRAILQGRDDSALDPGARPIRYGADIKLPGNQTADGSNIVQKGVWSSSSQWKLQVDGAAGRPSCALMGTSSRRVYLAVAPGSIADGAWHRVTCERAGTALRIAVDGAVRAQVGVPIGLYIANSAPLRVGGNGLSETSDRFHGSLDNVLVTVG